MPSLEGAPLPLMEVAVLLWNSTPHSVLRDRGQSEKSFQLPDSPPTGATELVFWAIMEIGGERKTLSILWTSGILHPDDWGNQLSPESAAAPVSNSEAQGVDEGISTKPWGKRVPTSSTSLAACTGLPHLFPQRQLQPFG